jgi:NAD-reducing hydrogenase large subunit
VVAKTDSKRIVIEPVTRVEGHGKVTIQLNDDRTIDQARLHIVEFRGFERFIQGRPYWEMPVVVQRLCGICPVSHHLCAAKAVDRIVGGEKLTETARKMRLLMHFGQFFQSHALHFFHLASPDLLFGFDAPVEKRNVFGVAGEFPDLAKQAVLMRKYGQEVILRTAGKKIHGTGAIPGGINKNLDLAERDELLADIDQMIAWSEQSVDIARDYTLKNIDIAKEFGSFDSNHVGLVREDGALEIYDGGLRAIDKDGETIFDHMDNQKYLDFIAEEVRPWSYMKFPFIKSLGPEKGWYRVGPLARVNCCDYIDTPLAEKRRQEFMGVTDGKPNNLTLAYHWARCIEIVHAAERMKELLNDPDLQGTNLVVKGERRHEGVGIIEAPRGTLFHHYRINNDDQVVMCNLIVSTTSNNEPMNRAVQKVARDHIAGKQPDEITDGLLNHIEVAIRAYDPCLSCATHAMGRMPLIVKLVDAEGNVLDEKKRGASICG